MGISSAALASLRNLWIHNNNSHFFYIQLE